MADEALKAIVKVVLRNGKHNVELIVGVQRFYLDYYASKREAQWMAKMLVNALKKAGARV